MGSLLEPGEATSESKTTIDPALHTPYLLANREMVVRHVVSNSFGFGGTNASLVIGRRRAP